MSLRSFLIAMTCATALAWIAWGSIITGINPFEAGLPGIALFYVTLSVACVGAVTLALSLIRIKWFKRKNIPSREVHTAFRHALLFTFVLIISLALSASGILQTWHLVSMVAVVVVLEQLVAHATRG